MPLYGTPRPGGNPVSGLNFTSLVPGDDFALLDGTEVIVTGSKSIPFARGTGPIGTDAGSSFYISGCTNGTQITIQGSNGVAPATTMTVANLDASFQDLPGAVFTWNNVYTDVGRATFYRAKVAVFAAGDVPVVLVKR